MCYNYNVTIKQEEEMAIIHQHDKRSGITYAYESHSYWDPEKKMVRAKRKLIGRIDPETGDIKPTDGRGRKKTNTEGKNLDYKEAYEKLLQKYESQEVLLETLKKELAKYKAAE